jgi:hypothetical protein
MVASLAFYFFEPVLFLYVAGQEMVVTGFGHKGDAGFQTG